MAKLAELINTHDVDVLEHLDRQVDVPVLTGLQHQGDVTVVPASMAGLGTRTAQTAVPKGGHPVVRGENGGNTHLLLHTPDVTFDPNSGVSAGDLALGTLTVAEGAVAYLAHPEHGYAGIGTGTYELRRKREQRDEIELIAD